VPRPLPAATNGLGRSPPQPPDPPASTNTGTFATPTANGAPVHYSSGSTQGATPHTGCNQRVRPVSPKTARPRTLHVNRLILPPRALGARPAWHTRTQAGHTSAARRVQTFAPRAARERRPTLCQWRTKTVAVERGGGGRGRGPSARVCDVGSEQADERGWIGGGGWVPMLVRGHPNAHQGPTIKRPVIAYVGRPGRATHFLECRRRRGDLRSPPQVSQPSPPPQSAAPPSFRTPPPPPSTKPRPPTAATSGSCSGGGRRIRSRDRRRRCRLRRLGRSHEPYGRGAASRCPGDPRRRCALPSENSAAPER